MEIYNDSYLVYIHFNQANGKCYVGVTRKNNPNDRWHNGNGYKYNTYFYNAIQKYGWDNFEHIIFASRLTKEEASSIERLLINKLQSDNPDFGYNICSGGYDCQGLSGIRNPFYKKVPTKAIEASIKSRIGKHLSEKQKKNISIANKGKPKSVEAISKSVATRKKNGYPDYSGAKNPSAKAVVCVETGIVYSTVKEASESIGVGKSAIVNAIKKNQRSKGFHWSYL